MIARPYATGQMLYAAAATADVTGTGGTGSLRRVARHGRRVAAEAEGETESFAHYTPEAATESDVDDKIH